MQIKDKVLIKVEDTDIVNGIFEIPTDVQGIGRECFWGRKTLREIFLPENIEYIGYAAFSNCTHLEKVIFSEGLKFIDKQVFWECHHLKTAILPKGLMKIGEMAFDGCSLLEEVFIPETVVEIGLHTFSYVPSLKKITVDVNNTFYACKGNCLIEKYTKTIIACGNEIAIPNDGSVEYIDGAFEGSGIKELHIPKSIKMCFGVNRFGLSTKGCNNLEKITVEEGHSCYSSKGNCLLLHGNILWSGCKNSVIPTDGSITKIATDAFADIQELTEIFIPKSVIKINDNAFYTDYSKRGPDGREPKPKLKNIYCETKYKVAKKKWGRCWQVTNACIYFGVNSARIKKNQG